MPQPRELPPVAIVHELWVSVAARSSRFWYLFYGRPSLDPVKVLFGLN